MTNDNKGNGSGPKDPNSPWFREGFAPQNDPAPLDGEIVTDGAVESEVMGSLGTKQQWADFVILVTQALNMLTLHQAHHCQKIAELEAAVLALTPETPVLDPNRPMLD